MIYVVSLTSSFRPILYPPFTCSSPGVISEVSLLVAMPQRVHQRQYFRIQNSRTDSRSIRSGFFITVCTKRTTFSANPVSLHTWTSRGDTWRATAYGNALSSEAIRGHFLITVCTERTTFSANPAFPHTCPPRGDMQLAKLNPTRYIISPGGVKTAIPNYFIHIVN